MSDKLNGIKLSERILPVPSSISREAQEALHRQVDLDGVPRNSVYRMPAPDDLAGWSRIQSQADAWYASALGEKLGEVRAGVETIQVASATIHIAAPASSSFDGCALLDLHGGALVFGGGDACRASTRLQAEQHGILCYGVDYRMPPNHPYPAALDDCMAAYRYMLERHRTEDIVICGRSAGGNLASAMLLRAHDEGLPVPAALILLSPEVDLSESGDSFQVNHLVDVVLPDSLMANNLLYASGAELTHPYLSPLFGDLSQGLPPTFLQTGTRDLFLSNTVRMHRALRKAGVPAELHVFEAMPHGGFGGTPEDRELVEEITCFMRAHIGS